MKRARAEAGGDSDAEDPGAPPETEGTGQREEEEDEAEYFRQAVGEEPDEGMWQGLVQLGTWGLSLWPGGPDTASLHRHVPQGSQTKTACRAPGQEAARKGAEARSRH